MTLLTTKQVQDIREINWTGAAREAVDDMADTILELTESRESLADALRRCLPALNDGNELGRMKALLDAYQNRRSEGQE